MMTDDAVTKREARLRTLTRTLQALRNSGKALVRAEDESSYLQEVCRIIVEDCGHAMVWIGFAENDGDKSIRPVTASGFEQGYLETLKLTWADTDRGQGPTGTAIRTGKCVLCRNIMTDASYAPWREEAMRRGYASSIALPLTCNGSTLGALSLYSREPDPFSEDELDLLTDLADDVAIGICSLRLRKANADAEQTLRQSEKQFRMLFENACDGIFITDTQGRFVDTNVRGLEMLGLARHELIGRSIGDLITPKEQARLPEALADVRSGRPHLEEWEFRRGDGVILCGEINGQLLPDGRMVGILRDLTESKRSQRERDLMIEFLRLVNTAKTSGELLHTAALFFKENTGCDAVGIRLSEGDDFPYRETLGFSNDFLQTESRLCECAQAGQPPSPACLCGKVISGRLPPLQTSFTEHGTFWSNDSAALLQIPFDARDRIRGRCIREGYGSIALLPLHDGQEHMGLLQLNARRKEAFTPEALALWECLADHLAVAVAKLQAEEALQASEELNRQTLQALPAHIAVIDRDGRVVAVNEAWADFARGNAASEAPSVQVGANYLEVCRRTSAADSSEAAQALAGIEAVLAGKSKQFSLEYPCHSPAEQRWFFMTVTPLAGNGAGGAVISHFNTTDRKLAETALRESEQRIQQALRVSHSFTFEWHRATDLVLRSASCGAILGLDGDDACRDTGQNFFRRVHPDDRERFTRMLDELRPDADTYTAEYRLPRPDGRCMTLEETGKAVFDDAGKMQRLVGVCADVTARKQAEQQLFETTQRLQALMTAVPVGISFSDDPTCQHISGNPAVLAQFEVAPADNLSAFAPFADAPGRQIQFFIGGRRITGDELPLQRAVSENRTVPPLELEVLLPSGHRWYADASGAPVRDAQGNVTGGIAVTVDITERKQTEDFLRFLGQCSASGSDENFFQLLARYLAQSLNMDFVCIDRLEEDRLSAQTLAVFHNGTFDDNVSYTLKDTPCGDVVGKRVCCFPQNVRGLFPKDAVLQELNAESYLGTTLWDTQGKPIGLIAVIGRKPLKNTRQAEAILQVSAVRAAGELMRLQVETARRASEERYRLLFQNVQEGFYLAEPLFDGDTCCDAVYLDVNPAFERIMGLPRERIVGRRAKELVPQVKPEWLEAFGKVARTGEPVSHQGYSETFRKHFEAFIFRPVAGQFAVLVSDITPRKQFEDALTRMNAELERRVSARTEELAKTNRELEAFCYSVSHDLRAPLRSMDGFSQALLEDYGPRLDTEGQDFLHRIRSSSQRMARLIDDLLQLSRLTRSQMQLQEVDLSALAQAAIADLRQSDPSRDVDVRIAPGLTAIGDPVLLRTALTNLLQNAWKFTGRRPDAVIEVGTEIGDRKTAVGDRPDINVVPTSGLRPPASPVFFVRDNGVGFDMRYADKLFTPFQRLHAMTEFPGTGIGLATVQRVLHRHGGRIWVEAAPGLGTTFYFTIETSLARRAQDLGFGKNPAVMSQTTQAEPRALNPALAGQRVACAAGVDA